MVCYDERPCFLIGDQIEPLAMQTGQVRKEHYAYEKNGSCALLAALVAQRMADKVKITWQFFVQSAHSKLNSHYVTVQSDNEKFKEI